MNPPQLIVGDCRDVMADMEADSVDALVCDPPYGLEFMGKDWDRLDLGDAWRAGGAMTAPGIGDRDIAWPSFGGGDSANATCATCGGRMRGARRCECVAPQWLVKGEPLAEANLYAAARSGRAQQAWHLSWATEAFRALKPGGHLLAFGGTRTSHRLTCALEDAGFEIRDTLSWTYAQGFPKSLDVGKAIDKAACVERDEGEPYVTPEAKRWQGFGTALKPSWEPIVLARKPLRGTVVANVLTHGTGALNIDACRVGWGAEGDLSADRKAQGYTEEAKKALGAVVAADSDTGFAGDVVGMDSARGRWPANTLLSHAEDCEPIGTRRVRADVGGFTEGSTGTMGATTGRYGAAAGQTGGERTAAGPVDADGLETVEAWACTPDCPVRMLDEQTGMLTSGEPGAMRLGENTGAAYGAESRLPGTPMVGYGDKGGASRFFYCAKVARAERNAGLASWPERPLLWSSGDQAPGTFQGDGTRRAAQNDHPTVKPVEVMRWLVRMVTPPGGVVLDPFMGSGSTGIACVLEDVDFIGVEKNPHYAEIAEARIGYAVATLAQQQSLW